LAKEERSNKNKELERICKYSLAEKYPEQEKVIAEILKDLEKSLMRTRILNEGIRLDGRNTEQVRKISVELGVLAKDTWFSSLYKR
jgi:polyribonucleotide nucleotidyltransferase